jgi:hypothetical protein
MALMTVTSGGVPVGNYTGRFGGVEDVLANPEKKFGPGIRWKFTIDDGPYCGQSVSRVTAPAPTFKNSCGKMLAGLVGRALSQDEQVDSDTFLGRRYMLVVAAGQEGGTRVEAVMLMPES